VRLATPVDDQEISAGCTDPGPPGDLKGPAEALVRRDPPHEDRVLPAALMEWAAGEVDPDVGCTDASGSDPRWLSEICAANGQMRHQQGARTRLESLCYRRSPPGRDVT
jgi:hypothetical protein